MAYQMDTSDVRTMAFENSNIHVVKMERLLGLSISDWEEAEPIYAKYVEISLYLTHEGIVDATRLLASIRQELAENNDQQQFGLNFLQNGAYAYVQHPLSCTIYDRADHIKTANLWATTYFESFRPQQLTLFLRFSPTIRSVDDALFTINWATRHFADFIN